MIKEQGATSITIDVTLDIHPEASKFAAGFQNKAKEKLTCDMLTSKKTAGESHAGPIQDTVRAFCHDLVLVWAMLAE